MQSIALARAIHVLAYVEVLRRIGAPVERELRRARLPMLLQEFADRYVPVLPAMNFLDSIARSEHLEDLGSLVTERSTFCRLRKDLQSSVRSAPTLYARLRRLGALVSAESTSLRLSMRMEGTRARLCLSLRDVPRVGGLQYSEWLHLDVLIDTIRGAIGPSWQPSEITFQAHFRIPPTAVERFPEARWRVGCAETSITVPLQLLGELLARPGPEHGRPAEFEDREVASVVGAPGFAESLKRALRAYLEEGYLGVDAAAEIAGVSTRTLQRRLVQAGLSYRALMREARIEAAAELLASGQVTVLDAAYSVGYTDPSNFSRAFRQVTGANPRRKSPGHSESVTDAARRSR